MGHPLSLKTSHCRVHIGGTEYQNVQAFEPGECCGNPRSRLRNAFPQLIQGLCWGLQGNKGGISERITCGVDVHNSDQLNETSVEAEMGIAGAKGVRRLSRAQRQYGERWRRHHETHPPVERDRSSNVADHVADVVDVAHTGICIGPDRKGSGGS